MAKEPARRYQAPDEVAKALKPFFKPGESGPVAAKTELSQPGQPRPAERVPRSGPPPAQPVADRAPAASKPAARKPAASTQPEVIWQDLLEIAEAEPLPAASKPVVPVPGWPRPPWLWPTLAAGVLLLGLTIAWAAGVFTIKTKGGVIVLENVPENAVVEVDGSKVTVTAGKGEPIRIEIRPGTHGVVVKQGSDPLLVDSVALEPGGERKLFVPVKKATENQPLPRPSAPEVAQKRAAGWISPSAKMEFVRIKAGEFMMGSPDGDTEAENDEKPQHTVRISPFYLGVTEVTQAQYLKVMGNNPSSYSSTGDGKQKVAGQSTARHPVESITWLDAIKLGNSLSKTDGLDAYYELAGDDIRVPNERGAGYRLPTEAEWEYACRAGTTTRYSFGDDASRLGEYAWDPDNSGGMTHAVSQRRPNAFGLYDMLGNVREWCWDNYDSAYYGRSPVDDPPGPSRAADRVIRGGALWYGPRFCRSADRGRCAPGSRHDFLGFRLALSQSGR